MKILAVMDKLLARTFADGDCLRWRGSIDRGGYGNMWFEGKWRRVHHVSYAAWSGATLDELAAVLNGRPRMSLDHAEGLGCRFRDCWNPHHLELVPHRVNTLRGGTLPARQIARTRCPRGHALYGANLKPSALRRGMRTCLLCARANSRADCHRRMGRRVSLEDFLPAVMEKFADAALDAQ